LPTICANTGVAVRKVEELIKNEGLPIANSLSQLEAMIGYLRKPAQFRVATQSHNAHERQNLCSALTILQIQSNGDVPVCCSMSPVGNIKSESIRKIGKVGRDGGNTVVVWRNDSASAK
jgi:hypothetical protein